MGTSRCKVEGAVSSQVLLPVSSISPSKFKLRRSLGNLSELKESISGLGLLQPIVVRKQGASRYEVVSGHRRLASCRELGLDHIPVIIADVDDKAAFEIQLTENIQRQSFAPIEEARAFYAYIGLSKRRGFGYGGVGELASRIGKSQEYVSSRIRLLRLPARLLEKMLGVDGFTVSHAEEIALLAGNPELVEKLTSLVVAKKITVRELERAIPLIKDGTDVESSVELVRQETRSRVKWDSQHEPDDSVETLLMRTKKMLESTLSYIDSAGYEIEVDKELHKIWVEDVRLKIHDAVDGVLFCERLRHGRKHADHRRPLEESFIWAG
jgi:ParB family transcriptional regulator, chromosome partitioning protein